MNAALYYTGKSTIAQGTPILFRHQRKKKWVLNTPLAFEILFQKLPRWQLQFAFKY